MFLHEFSFSINNLLWKRFLSSSARNSNSVILRDYQKQAINSINALFKQGIKRQSVVLATGGGKTVVFSHLIAQFVKDKVKGRHKVLVLAHREELVYQAANTISKINPTLEICIDMRKSLLRDDADVVVASVPTLVRLSRLQKYNKSHFSAIIIDECHHSTAKSWIKILNYFEALDQASDIAVIGFTATLERADGKSLGEVFQKIAYERNLSLMIKNKELADIHFSSVQVNIDFDKVEVKNKDFETESLSHVMNKPRNNTIICEAYLELRDKFKLRSTLVFCVNVAHCKTICSVLQSYGVNAQYITGETRKEERQSIIEDFKKGRIDVLCNVQVFTEGTDIPNIDSLILARPTKSKTLLAQMIGRGLRIHEGKTSCHVIDVCSTINTGFQSVPILFDLPSDYVVHGKSYQDLDYAQKLEIQREEEEKKTTKELERMKIENESKKMLAYVRKQDECLLSITTIDSFLEYDNDYDSRRKQDSINAKFISKKTKRNNLNWIRLSWNSWGVPLRNNDFLLLEAEMSRRSEKISVIYKLTLNRFTDYSMKKASGFLCGNYYVKKEIITGPYLDEILAKSSTAFGRLDFNSSMHNKFAAVSQKQVSFVCNKLTPKLKRMYNPDENLATKLEEEVAKLSPKSISILIFAVKISVNSFWINWQLFKMLGPSKKLSASILKRVG